MGTVSEIRGKYVKQFGVREQSEFLLYPEEVEFLVEQGYLSVSFTDSSTMTDIVECVDRFCYAAYSDCRVLGHRLFRHNQVFPSNSKQGQEPKCHEFIDSMMAQQGVVTWDMYDKRSNFSRKTPTQPDYSMIVMNSQSNMPSLSTIQSLILHNPAKSIVFAIVSTSLEGDSRKLNLFYYQFENQLLPSYFL